MGQDWGLVERCTVLNNSGHTHKNDEEYFS